MNLGNVKTRNENTMCLINELVDAISSVRAGVNVLRCAVYAPRPEAVGCGSEIKKTPETINEYLQDAIEWTNQEAKSLHFIAEEIRNNLGDVKIL